MLYFTKDDSVQFKTNGDFRIVSFDIILINTEKKMLKCGQTNVYLKPECVCSFYNVFEAIYHGFSSCPERDNADIVTQLKCRFKIQKMYYRYKFIFQHPFSMYCMH